MTETVDRKLLPSEALEELTEYSDAETPHNSVLATSSFLSPSALFKDLKSTLKKKIEGRKKDFQRNMRRNTSNRK